MQCQHFLTHLQNNFIFPWHFHQNSSPWLFPDFPSWYALICDFSEDKPPKSPFTCIRCFILVSKHRMGASNEENLQEPINYKVPAFNVYFSISPSFDYFDCSFLNIAWEYCSIFYSTHKTSLNSIVQKYHLK